MKRCNLVLELLVAFLAFVTIPLAAMGQSPDIVLDPPDFINFGQVGVGTSSSATITISNVGSAPAELDFYIFPEHPDFSITLGPQTPFPLAPGGWVDVEVTFFPSDAGLESTFFWAEPGLPNVLLTGVGKDSQIVVSHSAIDFGEVAVGTSSTETVTITSTGSDSLLLKGIVIVGDPDFAITSSLPEMPFEVAPGGFLVVDVTFSPSVEGDHEAFLMIESDAGTPAEDIPLTGKGVVVELPPEEQIIAILAFVDTSVEAGTLQGDGPGSSAPKRLNALTHMLEATAGLIEEGLYEEAYQQLMAAYKKTDGAGRPPDFVAGDAASVLAAMIQTLLESLE